MKNKVFLWIYYLTFILIALAFFGTIFMINSGKYTSDFMAITQLNFWLVFVAFVLFIIFNILFIIERKIEISREDIMLEISFIVFVLLIFIFCKIFDNKLLIPEIEYSYYITIALIPYVLLNTYSLFLIKKSHKKKKIKDKS